MAIVCNRSLFNKYGWMAFVCYFEDSKGTSMNNIETMKMALEALEWHLPIIEDFAGKEELNRQHKAITALRQAIEQAQQAEPVAWMSPNNESFVHAEDVGNSVPNWTDYYTIPLYTFPPPRQPLTDEKLEEMAEAHVTDCYFDTLKYARAIEAAHGIKENT
jgi:hypothetical protein